MFVPLIGLAIGGLGLWITITRKPPIPIVIVQNATNPSVPPPTPAAAQLQAPTQLDPVRPSPVAVTPAQVAAVIVQGATLPPPPQLPDPQTALDAAVVLVSPHV